MAGSEQRVLLQPVQGSLENSEAVRVLHSWLVRLQLELQGCHISVAAVGKCQQWRLHPSSLPESLCWHGLTAPGQEHVVALGNKRGFNIKGIVEPKTNQSYV